MAQSEAAKIIEYSQVSFASWERTELTPSIPGP
ncbi:hypothetical protein CCACVL1_09005 [Corchorus capsularis]|uniref:Uncharacterized protein n=1 Tax=Corchorus capsularis TaxID=210143 RepID=A0A1R3IY21_COCAP|nr:hypothetical protein CCACVL1_09005 [Corchorus capsularis]